jgi:hypothetical protein
LSIRFYTSAFFLFSLFLKGIAVTFQDGDLSITLEKNKAGERTKLLAVD